MSMRTCGICKVAKPLDEFPPNGKGKTRHHCRTCENQRQVAIQRARYQANRDMHLAKAAVNDAVGRAEEWMASPPGTPTPKGRMIFRPRLCHTCGCEGNGERLFAHHRRKYAKPAWYDVLWLCRRCHGEVHHLMRAAEKRRGLAEDGLKEFLRRHGCAPMVELPPAHFDAHGNSERPGRAYNHCGDEQRSANVA